MRRLRQPRSYQNSEKGRFAGAILRPNHASATISLADEMRVVFRRVEEFVGRLLDRGANTLPRTPNEGTDVPGRCGHAVSVERLAEICAIGAILLFVFAWIESVLAP